MFKRIKEQKGMTLIEIMVVITIIAMISTFAVVNIMSRLDEAKQKKAKIQMKIFESALDEFKRDNGFYPQTEQGLQALVEKPSIGRIPKHYPAGAYIKGKKIPKDPFDCDYGYFSPGVRGYDYEIYSYGDDCQEGGDGINKDISSFDEDEEE